MKTKTKFSKIWPFLALPLLAVISGPKAEASELPEISRVKISELHFEPTEPEKEFTLFKNVPGSEKPVPFSVPLNEPGQEKPVERSPVPVKDLKVDRQIENEDLGESVIKSEFTDREIKEIKEKIKDVTEGLAEHKLSLEKGGLFFNPKEHYKAGINKKGLSFGYEKKSNNKMTNVNLGKEGIQIERKFKLK